jgi:hypothetical protein
LQYVSDWGVIYSPFISEENLELFKSLPLSKQAIFRYILGPNHDRASFDSACKVVLGSFK